MRSFFNFIQEESIMFRRLEFIGGNSAKFWEASVTGTDVEVRYGRIGTEGQVNIKPFDDQQAAFAHAEKLVKQKLAKGYVECAAT